LNEGGTRELSKRPKFHANLAAIQVQVLIFGFIALSTPHSRLRCLALRRRASPNTENAEYVKTLQVESILQEFQVL
jgi:hypothetical protein